MNTNTKIFLTFILFLLVIGMSFKSYNKILEDEEILAVKNPNIIELDPYENISITALSADITIKRGDTYTLEYKLHPREEAKQAQVVGDTFYFSTDFTNKYREEWDTNLYDWFIILSIPENKDLNRVEIRTVEGDIMLSNWDIEYANIRTTSGEIWLSDIQSKYVKLESVTESVEVFASNIDNLDVYTVSDSIKVEGNFNNVNIANMSDICEFNGVIRQSMSISSVSGDIILKIQENADIKATTFKNIFFNDKKYQFSLNHSTQKSIYEYKIPQIELNTTGGRIKIDTHEYLESK